MAARTAANKKTPVNPPAEVEQVDSDDKKTRTQLAMVLNINISQARCATHLKQNLGDEETETEIKELRARLAAAKEASQAQDVLDAFKAQIAEKSKKLVRISSATPIAVAVICDSTVKELLRHGMDAAHAAESKVVNPIHLHMGKPEDLVYFPLYDKCDVWNKYSEEREDELKRAKAAAAKVAKEARDAAKAALAPPVVAVPAVAPAAAPKKKKAAAVVAPVVVAPPPPVVADDDGVKTTFNTYVENALKAVRLENKEKYDTLRVTNRIRTYLSDLVIQMIARQAKLARVMVQMIMGVRTMNDGHVKAAVNILMTDSNRSNEQIKLVTDQVNEKLKLYTNHTDSERKKKHDSLDEDKRTDIRRKQLENDLQRKNKQASNAEAQAIKAAKRCKELKVEADKLQKDITADA